MCFLPLCLSSSQRWDIREDCRWTTGRLKTFVVFTLVWAPSGSFGECLKEHLPKVFSGGCDTQRCCFTATESCQQTCCKSINLEPARWTSINLGWNHFVHGSDDIITQKISVALKQHCPKGRWGTNRGSPKECWQIISNSNTNIFNSIVCSSDHIL